MVEPEDAPQERGRLAGDADTHAEGAGGHGGYGVPDDAEVGQAGPDEVDGPRACGGRHELAVVGAQRPFHGAEDVRLCPAAARVAQRHHARPGEGRQIGGVLRIAPVQDEGPTFEGERPDREQADEAAGDDDEGICPR